MCIRDSSLPFSSGDQLDWKRTPFSLSKWYAKLSIHDILRNTLKRLHNLLNGWNNEIYPAYYFKVLIKTIATKFVPSFSNRVCYLYDVLGLLNCFQFCWYVFNFDMFIKKSRILIFWIPPCKCTYKTYFTISRMAFCLYVFGHWCTYLTYLLFCVCFI